MRLIRRGSQATTSIALGIELKGWFLLSKEGEPSYRFTTTAAACTDHDLLVVVPWHLDNVLSGTPVAAEPWIASSKWSADYRNYYWQHLRGTSDDTTISVPAAAHPYPTKDEASADVPAYDGGGNFGRVARVRGLMTNWIDETNKIEVLGIRITDWRNFLKLHSDNADLDAVTQQLEARVARELRGGGKADERAQTILQAFRDAAEALSAG